MANPPTSRIPLYAPLGSRSGSIQTDARLYNAFAEKGQGDDKEVKIFKRPGLTDYLILPPGNGQGVTYWNGSIFTIVGGVLYAGNSSLGAVNNTGIYSFSSCLGATPKLFFQNTVNAYTFDNTNGLVEVTNANYPTNVIPGATYVDGTNYVGTRGAGIYGSDINDPQTWDPLNFLLAQIEPEAAVAIAKQLVYVIMLKETSTEVFYDAGNAAGSPLGPVQGSKCGVGCQAAGTVKRLGDDLAWIGSTTEGDVQAMLMKNVRAEPISTPPVERVLRSLDYSTCWSWGAKVLGHRFYVVTSVPSNITLAYDLTSGAWYIWTDANGNYMPICASTYDRNAGAIVQHATNGKLYYFDGATYQDDGENFTVQIYTPNIDAGIKVVKSSGRAEAVADQDQTTVEISWSDDDYQTFTTPQPVALGNDRPWIQDGSSFSKRAFCITQTDNAPLRISALDITVSAGNS